MDNIYLDNLKNKVCEMLASNPHRYWHTIGVANTAACLAMRYGADMQSAYAAGLLHDCAKCLSDDELLGECAKFNIQVSEYEQISPYLLHGKVGAYYAKHRFDIDGEDILSAITNHTTGRPDMSMLEKIIFIADYIEPYRDKADNLDEIRQLAFDDIDMAIYRVCKDTIKYLEKKEATIDKTTVETYEFYKNLVESR